jgi:hypothetical protein
MNLMYIPSIKEAKPLERIRLGGYEIVFLGNVESVGAIRYKYIVVVFKAGENKPIYFVSSEENVLAKELGGGTHFLCAFEDDRHVNFGCSDEWADYEKFANRALQLVKDKFHILEES